MCGRFAAIKALRDLAKFYNADIALSAAGFTGSYNLCPTEPTPIVMENPDQFRTIELGKFGIPTVAGGKTFPLLNLQSERIENREGFKTRRCIIPADGFFEWEKITPKDKQPHFYSPRDGFFSFAGVWKEDSTGLSFAIVTTSANELLAPVHNRMPVILSHNAVGQWLTSGSDKDTLKDLMHPYPAGLMQAWKVSKMVNSPKNKDAACINSL